MQDKSDQREDQRKARPPVRQVLADAAAGQQLFAGQPCRIIGSEKDGNRGNIARLANASKRRSLDYIFLEIAADKSRSMRAFRLNQAWVQRIDADLLRSELTRQDTGNRIHRTLGPGIHRARRRRDATDH